MNSRVPIIGGNWKMNLNLQEAKDLATLLGQQFHASKESVQVVLFPSFPVLDAVTNILDSSPIEVGAQNISDSENGAHTGEVSGEIVASTGCRWVLVGHSERRHLYGEGFALVRRKLDRVLASGLKPLVCVGETLEERDKGQAKRIIESQVSSALESLNEKSLEQVVLAYEPVWAIGTGRHASPDQAQEAHSWIRAHLAVLFGSKIAEITRIQYGGSVKSENAKPLLDCPDVDGALVGGASLNGDSFLSIIKAIAA